MCTQTTQRTWPGSRRWLSEATGTLLQPWGHAPCQCLLVQASTTDWFTASTDQVRKQQLLSRFSAYREQDVLILSGDVSDDLAILRATLASLRRTFGRVFFVPGNHDLWLRAESTDISGEQLDAR